MLYNAKSDDKCGKIEGIVSEYWSSIYWSGILTHGNLAQHQNKYFQCGNAWSERGYAQIVTFDISDALA